MLKIKDNVDLKELEKFIGLELTANAFTKSTYIITGVSHDDYLKDFDKNYYNVKDDLCFELDNGDDFISIYTLENFGNVFIDSPQLQDLIKDGLVEKVEE